MTSQSAPAIRHDPALDIGYIFRQGFKDEEFRQKQKGEPFDLDKCLNEGVYRAELAGWHFSGPDKVVVDQEWFNRALALFNRDGPVCERHSHMQAYGRVFGKALVQTTVMGAAYWLPHEIVALLRAQGVRS